MSTQYNATVTLRVDLAPGTMVLRVKMDDGPFDYKPGQYTVLGLHRSATRIPKYPNDSKKLSEKPHDFLVRRAYSITSNSEAEELEFVVTLVKSGDLTPRLFALQEGGRLYVEPAASGMFTLGMSSGNRDLLMVGTGSALAPYMAMIRAGFAESSSEQQFVVIQAAAHSDDLAFRHQLEELEQQTNRLTYIPVVLDMEQDPQWEGLTGTVEELIENGEIENTTGIPITPDRYDVYLSGAPEMIEAVTTALMDRDFQTGAPDDPETDIHVERYW